MTELQVRGGLFPRVAKNKGVRAGWHVHVLEFQNNVVLYNRANRGSTRASTCTGMCRELKIFFPCPLEDKKKEKKKEHIYFTASCGTKLLACTCIRHLFFPAESVGFDAPVFGTRRRPRMPTQLLYPIDGCIPAKSESGSSCLADQQRGCFGFFLAAAQGRKQLRLRVSPLHRQVPRASLRCKPLSQRPQAAASLVRTFYSWKKPNGIAGAVHADGYRLLWQAQRCVHDVGTTTCCILICADMRLIVSFAASPAAITFLGQLPQQKLPPTSVRT